MNHRMCSRMVSLILGLSVLMAVSTAFGQEGEAEITIRKTAEQQNFREAGEVIVYWIGIENTGDVLFQTVTVTDPLLGLAKTVAFLAASAGTLYFNESYTVTEADVNAGSIANTATVIGVTENADTVTHQVTLTIPKATDNGEDEDECFLSTLPWDLYGGIAAVVGLGFGILWLADDPTSPCMVASAAYGTPMAAQISLLRRFRDTWLLNSAAGTAFVDIYYRNGGLVADYVAEHAWAAQTVRLLLYPVLFFVALALLAPQFLASAAVVMSGCLLVMVVYLRKRHAVLYKAGTGATV